MPLISDLKFKVTNSKKAALSTASLIIPSTEAGGVADADGLITVNVCFGTILKDVSVTNADYCPSTMTVSADESPSITIPVELKLMTSKTFYGQK